MSNLVSSFSIIHRQSAIYLDRELHTLGVSFGQFMYIVCICEQEGISQEKMAELLRIDRSAVARQAKQLEQDGYILRQTDPRDRRQYRLVPTEKAKEVHVHIRAILRGWEKELTQNLTEIEASVLGDLLDKVILSLK